MTESVGDKESMSFCHIIIISTIKGLPTDRPPKGKYYPRESVMQMRVWARVIARPSFCSFSSLGASPVSRFPLRYHPTVGAGRAPRVSHSKLSCWPSLSGPRTVPFFRIFFSSSRIKIADGGTGGGGGEEQKPEDIKCYGMVFLSHHSYFIFLRTTGFFGNNRDYLHSGITGGDLHLPSTFTSMLYTAKLLQVSRGSMKVLSHK